MGANFIYQSKTLEERIKNATNAFEKLINEELKKVGAKYQIKFDDKVIPNSTVFKNTINYS